jgi:mannosyltransferase OCH1-like enzyme
MADSFLSFANSSSFRNQLVVRNLQPYTVAGVFSSPQSNINYETKANYTSIIPLKVYTHWHSKQLLPKMSENYTKLKNENPELEFFLFDENDSREFIKNNFNSEVLNAYNKLLPCAYKADLWRYCVLYINGGIYLDIKYGCTNGFKLIELTDKEYFVRYISEKNIYNALIVSLPKNEILLKEGKRRKSTVCETLNFPFCISPAPKVENNLDEFFTIGVIVIILSSSSARASK